MRRKLMGATVMCVGGSAVVYQFVTHDPAAPVTFSNLLPVVLGLSGALVGWIDFLGLLE